MTKKLEVGEVCYLIPKDTLDDLFQLIETAVLSDDAFMELKDLWQNITEMDGVTAFVYSGMKEPDKDVMLGDIGQFSPEEIAMIARREFINSLEELAK